MHTIDMLLLLVGVFLTFDRGSALPSENGKLNFIKHRFIFLSLFMINHEKTVTVCSALCSSVGLKIEFIFSLIESEAFGACM